jgi:Uma2 family endonuclease
MNPKTAATIDDLYRVPGKAELVGGEIVMMPPAGGLFGHSALEVGASLQDFARRTKLGYALGSNVGFVVDLPNRKSFCPDVAYHIGPLSMKFIDGAPALAVEIRSEGDYGPAAEQEVADKRADYFAAGTQVVWDVDLQSPDIVRVYRSADPNPPTIYRRGQLAEAEPAVPGWTMPVDDLLPPEQH